MWPFQMPKESQSIIKNTGKLSLGGTKNFIIGGKSTDRSQNIIYNDAGTLTLSKGTIQQEGVLDSTSANRYAIASFNNGSVTISGAIIKTTSDSTSTKDSGVKYYGEKTLIVTSGTISTKGNAIMSSSTATSESSPALKVTGGTIESTGDNAILNESIGLIYINGSNQSVFKDKYTWDPNSGNIQLNIDPILIDNITVKIKKKSLLEKIISLKNIFAETATYENMASSGELESEPSLNTGDDMIINGINTWYFWPSCQTEENACSYPTDVINAYKNGDKYLYSKCDNGNCTLSESLYEDFIVKFEGEYKSDNKSLKFKNAIYASLFCNDHSNDASRTNVNGSFNLHVIKIDKDAKYVIVKLIGASQAWQGGQTPAGVLKFTWSTPAQGSIAVKKVLY